MGLLVVLVFGVRPALRRADAALLKAGKEKSKELPASATRAATGAPPAPASLVADADRLRAQTIFDQVTSELRREPAQSSRLLESWIHSE